MKTTHPMKDLIRHRQKITGPPRKFPRAPIPRRPLQYKAAYLKYLYSIIKWLEHEVKIKLIPRLPAILDRATAKHPGRKDALDDELEDALNSIDVAFESEFAEDELIKKVMLFADGEQKANAKSSKDTIKKVTGIDVFYEEPYLEDFIRTFAVANAGLITKMKDDVLDQISQRVFEAFRAGTRAEDLSDEIADRFGVSESRANTIARDQFSKLNAGLDRLRQQELGVNKYTWRGVDDNRERDSHRENNNEVFSYDDPPVETGNPGDDVNCRCWAEPYWPDLFTGPDDDSEDQDSQI